MENLLLAAIILITFLSFLATAAFFRLGGSRIRKYRRLGLVSGNILILLSALSLISLAGELYYRFIYNTTDSYGLSRTTTQWFSRHFRLNRSMFRDNLEYQPDIAPGKRRVTFIGDSFTAGHGVNDVNHRFVNLIRSRNTDQEVHALARCGWDTGHQIEILQITSRVSYELDVVVLVYCLNDISDILPEWHSMLNQLYNQPEPGFLIENSFFLNTMYCRAQVMRNPELSNYFSFVSDGYDGHSWKVQRQRLTGLCNEVRKKDATFLAVTFPFLHGLEQDYQFRHIHEKLGDHWATLNVPHLDLLETFEDYSSDQLMVNSYDAHPNPFAHALAADAILEFLNSQRTDADH